MFKKITVIAQDTFKQPVEEEIENDIIKVDVPLMIRLLEYAREDANTDMDLHNVAEKLTTLTKEEDEALTMEYYNEIVGKPSVMTEETMKFRMDSRTMWSRFGWSPLNYSIALNNDIGGIDEAEVRIYKHANALGNFVVPYYGEEVGTTISKALSVFGRIGVEVMQDLKNGKPLDGTKARWDQSVEDIAAYLSSINPEYWPKEAVKSYFDSLVNLWIESIRARDEGDFATNEIVIDGIEKLVTMGNGESDSLADVFSAGIISQFPEKFTK